MTEKACTKCGYTGTLRAMPGLGKSGVMVCPRCTEPVREMTPEDRAPADTKPVDPALVGVVPAFAPCTKGCGEMTTGGGACFDCTRKGDNKNKIADTTEASIPAGFRWARFEEPLLRQRLQASFDRVGMSKPTVDEVLTAARDAATANRVMLVGSTGKGKAHPVGTAVLTPGGWRAIESLRVGDFVIGRSGQPTEVRGVYDRGRLPVFRVSVSDGGSVRACGDHLWETRTAKDRGAARRGDVRTTRDIKATLTVHADRRLNHSIPYVRPVHFAAQAEPLPLGAYALGAYLGDGCFPDAGQVVLTNADADVVARFAAGLPGSDEVTSREITHRVRRKKRTREQSDTAQILTALGLRGAHSEAKFIPERYMLASVHDRIELLRGIFDTDGHVSRVGGGGLVELTTTSARLAADTAFVVQSLGGRATIFPKKTRCSYKGQVVQGYAYRARYSFPQGDFVPVLTASKVASFRPGGQRLRERYIEHVSEDGTAECRCIRVAAPDGLYVTESFIVTHNTSLVVAMMRQWVRANASSALFVYTPDLVTSRMRTKLGREADMVPEAMAAPLLVLDDVGGGDVKLQAGPLEEVIHKRHAERKPTWATTWMLPKSMTDGNRYSGGFVRRLFEGVREIDLVGSR